MGEALLESMGAVEAALADLAKRVDGEAWQLSESDVVDVTKRLHALSSKAQGVQVRMVRELDTRGVADSLGATSLRNFLAGALRLSPGAAGEYARLSKAFHETNPDTGAALAAGRVNFEQAARITRMLGKLPSKATAENRAWAEGFLLHHADALDADDLAKLSKRIDAAIDPDGTLPREKLAAERRAANIRNHHDGTQTLTWRDTDERIAEAKAAMFALAAPAPHEDGTRDERTPEQRRADAVGEIVRRAMNHGELPTSRGERPKLIVWASAATMATGTGFGRTATGEDLPAEAVRRIACDADVMGLVMTEFGAPLNLGRRRRTVSPAQWVALVARDTGCQMPGCTRPAEYCEGHHLIHWIDGGRTDLDNLGLFCGHHHHWIHDKFWEVLLGPDRRIWLRPPTWIEPERTPIRNTYWDTQQAVGDCLQT